MNTVSLIGALALASQVAATTIHVDDDAAPGGDGSIRSPFATIQAAIDDSVNGDTVLVADGTYTGDGNRDLNFGGRNITLRSENGLESCLIDVDNAIDETHRALVFDSGETAAARVEGFTIQGGIFTQGFDVAGPLDGGVIIIAGAGPTFVDCHLGGGIADWAPINFQNRGGTIHTTGSPHFTRCTIDGSVFSIDGGFGGAIYSTGTLTLTDCTISGSVSGCSPAGGGIYRGGGTVTATRCRFEDCSASGGAFCGPGGGARAGAVFGGGTFIACEFVGNRAIVCCNNFISAEGGAVLGGTYVNCLFADNVVESSDGGEVSDAEGGAGFGGSYVNCVFAGNVASGERVTDGSAVQGGNLINSIIWGNAVPQFSGSATYSLVQGGAPGTGNIDADPRFVDPIAGDYRLAPGSPAIDAGKNGAISHPLDLDGLPRFLDDPATPDTGAGTPPIVDMGPYEFALPPEFVIVADVNGDGVVDASDLNAVIQAWGLCIDCPEDIDGDFFVNVDDLVLVITNWGQTDCNGNTVIDQVELGLDPALDCNDNGRHDACDIAAGVSADCNGNGVPDECEDDG